MSDTHSITQYGLTNTQAHTYLMYHAIDNKTDHAIRDIQTAIDTLKQGASAQTALWHRCRQLDVSATPPPVRQHMLYDSFLLRYKPINCGSTFHVSCKLVTSH